MLSEPTLSVVIPTYGVERWLREFLDSLLAQTFTDWVAHVVIDGSPDGSEAIARRYAQRDERVQVHVFENGGLGRARNRGMELATGTWIAFPDSDDLLPPHAFETLVEAGQKADADISTGVADDFFEDGREVRYWTTDGPMFAEHRSVLNIDTEPTLIWDHTAWNKIFRRAFLVEHGIRFAEDTLCEDVVALTRAYLLARRVAVSDELVYLHRRREGAITEDLLGPRILGDWIRQHRGVWEVLADAPEPVRERSAHRLLDRELWSRVSGAQAIADSEDRDALRDFIREIATGVGADAFAALNRRKRLGTQGVMDGWLLEAWAGETEIFPLKYGSGRGDLPGLLRLLAKLDRSEPLQDELWALLVGAEVIRPVLADRSALPEAELSARMAALRELWPGGIPAGDASRMPIADETAVLLVDAANARDAARFAEVLQAELLELSAPALSLAWRASGLRISGELRFEGEFGPGARIELVARSADDSARTRTSVAQWQPVEGDAGSGLAVSGLAVWGATLPLEVCEPGERWRLWLRITRPGLARRDVVVSAGQHLSAIPAAPTGGGRVGASPIAGPVLTVAFEAGPAANPSAPARVSAPGADATSGLGRTIIAFPLRPDNPYQSLLYLQPSIEGYRVEGISPFDELLERVRTAGPRDTLHVHWTQRIAQTTPSRAHARRRMTLFTSTVSSAQRRGMRLIWTVHHRASRELPHPDVDAQLTAFLLQRADAVHVMTEQVADELRVRFRAAEPNIVVIPHSSYDGVYGPPVDRARARAELGVEPDELAVLAFGQLRPDKELERLFAAVERAASARPLVLLLAGQPSPDYADALQAALPGGVRVIAHLERVQDRDTALWFSAADVAVFPAPTVLESGAFLLAKTFGVDTVIPRLSERDDDGVARGWVTFFDPEHPDALAELLATGQFGDPARRAATIAQAHAERPSVMSRRFAALLAQLHGEQEARSA